MKNVLLTGATGYIGSNIARTLLCEGYEVHIIARPFSGFDLLADIKNNVKIHIYNGEPEKLNDIFKEIHPDILIHLASIYVAEHQAKDIGSLVNSNILFGTEVLNAAISCGVNYFINTGSYWQNYNGDAYNPVNLYAATKQAFECIMKYYREVSKLRSVTIKLVDTYG
ncbi:MAG: NAD(P)-dependent oxidoreductase, partial [Clostridiaceae bacterium]|nr:NAD(P)-dependent oxidoreductase [Clostridiaceae bacterium]